MIRGWVGGGGVGGMWMAFGSAYSSAVRSDANAPRQGRGWRSWQHIWQQLGAAHPPSHPPVEAVGHNLIQHLVQRRVGAAAGEGVGLGGSRGL